MIKKLLMLAGVLAASSSRAGAQSRTQTIGLTRQAYAMLDSLATFSRQTRLEGAACLATHRYAGDTLILQQIDTAVTHKADSLSIYGIPALRLCPDSLPYIHTHVAKNKKPLWPSDLDLAVAAARHTFGVIIEVDDDRWTLLLYNLPERPQ